MIKLSVDVIHMLPSGQVGSCGDGGKLYPLETVTQVQRRFQLPTVLRSPNQGSWRWATHPMVIYCHDSSLI